MFRRKDSSGSVGFQIADLPEERATSGLAEEAQSVDHWANLSGTTVTVPAESYSLLTAVVRRAIDPEYYAKMINDYNNYVLYGKPEKSINFKEIYDDN